MVTCDYNCDIIIFSSILYCKTGAGDDVTKWNAMEWNGMQWNGVKWNATKWNGVKWNAMECNAMQWNGMHRLTLYFCYQLPPPPPHLQRPFAPLQGRLRVLAVVPLYMCSQYSINSYN